MVKNTKKIKEHIIEEYFCKRIKELGGVTWKNNPAWAVGILDRTFAVRSYVGVVEFKRPVGGRLSKSQISWDSRLTRAGCPCHHIRTKEEVDEVIRMVLERDRMTPTITDDIVETAIAAGLQAANDHMAMDADWLKLFARGVLEHAAKPRLTTAALERLGAAHGQ